MERRKGVTRAFPVPPAPPVPVPPVVLLSQQRQKQQDCVCHVDPSCLAVNLLSSMCRCPTAEEWQPFTARPGSGRADSGVGKQPSGLRRSDRTEFTTRGFPVVFWQLLTLDQNNALIQGCLKKKDYSLFFSLLFLLPLILSFILSAFLCFLSKLFQSVFPFFILSVFLVLSFPLSFLLLRFLFSFIFSLFPPSLSFMSFFLSHFSVLLCFLLFFYFLTSLHFTPLFLSSVIIFFSSFFLPS